MTPLVALMITLQGGFHHSRIRREILTWFYVQLMDVGCVSNLILNGENVYFIRHFSLFLLHLDFDILLKLQVQATCKLMVYLLYIWTIDYYVEW
jgi:hypothetical protein